MVDATGNAETGGFLHVAVELGVNDLVAFRGFDEGEGDVLGEGLLPIDCFLPAGDVNTSDGKGV